MTDESESDELRLCDDSPTLDKLVCWPADLRVATAMFNLLDECGIDCRKEYDNGLPKIFVATADQAAANAAFKGLIYGLVERDTDVARLLDIIRRLRDFAPPAPHARDRDVAQYAVAIRDAERVLPKKGGAE